ncbi:MAG: hypothetical protein IJU68_07470 [Bacteroidales bacterium]|nr:hypothetical protein [Bacteroidales bacterium]
MFDPKKFLYAIAAVSAAAMLASCNPVNPEPEPEPEPEPVTLTLNFVLPEGGAKTAWAAGDKIVIHGEYASTQVTVTLEAGDIKGRTATKSVENLFPYEREDCKSTLYAAWPAEAVDNLPHCFFYSKFNTTNREIMAACNVGDTFTFKPVCSAVSFTVNGDYEEYAFSGNKKAVLGYEFLQVKVTDAVENLLQYKGDPIQAVTAPFVKGANLVCFPGDIELEKGFALKLRKGGKAVKAYFVHNAVSLVRGGVLDLGDITAALEDYDDPLSDDIISLDAAGGANCYIVSAPGAYKFKALKGGSKQEIGEPASAEVLWETWNTTEEPASGSVVASAAYADDYIIIHMPAALHPGNAVVAARDADGAILWSWHIWVPQTPVTADSYGDIMGAAVMSRNLGALVDTKAEGMVDPLSYGLVYQWGRKDPFVNSPTALKNDLAAYVGAAEEVAAGQISLADAIGNPRLLGHTNDGNWMDEVDETLWSNDEKSIYDPCPPGYRVPARNTNKPFWSGNLTAAAGWKADGTNGWLTIGEPVAVFPIAGYRDDYDVKGMAKVGARTLYWTAHGSEAKAACADLRYDKGTFKLGSAPKARLGSVRCVAE